MYFDLIDIGEQTIATNVNDNVQGFNIPQCFNALQSNVTTVREYQQQFLQQNGNAQAVAVGQLITDYRY